MVQKLKKSGQSDKEIARVTGISPKTIGRVAKEKEIESTSEEDFRKSHPVGRPSKVSDYEALVQQWLSEPRDLADGPLKSGEIYARLTERGCEASKSAVYEMVRRLRPFIGPESDRPIRGSARRVLATRLRAETGHFRGRDNADNSLFRLAPEILALKWYPKTGQGSKL